MRRQLSARLRWLNCGQVGERGNCPLTEVTHVLRPAEIRQTDNPMSSAHQKCLRTATKSSGQGAKVDVDCCSVRLSYFHRSGRADLNRQPTVPITHNLRPAENTTDKKRTGNTCSTTELLRHLVPEAGLEPATTSL